MSKTPKLREPEARILALRIAAKFPNHEATTAEIKDAVPEYREFSDADLLPSKSRKGECMWQQIMGNVVSHKNTSVSIFNKGYAERTHDGIRVTEKGIAMLGEKGLYP